MWPPLRVRTAGLLSPSKYGAVGAVEWASEGTAMAPTKGDPSRARATRRVQPLQPPSLHTHFLLTVPPPRVSDSRTPTLSPPRSPFALPPSYGPQFAVHVQQNQHASSLTSLLPRPFPSPVLRPLRPIAHRRRPRRRQRRSRAAEGGGDGDGGGGVRGRRSRRRGGGLSLIHISEPTRRS
eukprot:6509485-Prymnesium_polylepis.1